MFGAVSAQIVHRVFLVFSKVLRPERAQHARHELPQIVGYEGRKHRTPGYQPESQTMTGRSTKSEKMASAHTQPMAGRHPATKERFVGGLGLVHFKLAP